MKAVTDAPTLVEAESVSAPVSAPPAVDAEKFTEDVTTVGSSSGEEDKKASAMRQGASFPSGGHTTTHTLS